MRSFSLLQLLTYNMENKIFNFECFTFVSPKYKINEYDFSKLHFFLILQHCEALLTH